VNVVANTRNHRLNVQYIRANYSPASSAFGYYTGGITGNIIASAFSVFSRKRTAPRLLDVSDVSQRTRHLGAPTAARGMRKAR
jgi:hypothetical protein